MILPALLCAVCYTNDDRYLPGNLGPEFESSRTERKSNVEFYQENSTDGTAGFPDSRIVSRGTLQNIDAGEEFYCDCGKS